MCASAGLLFFRSSYLVASQRVAMALLLLATMIISSVGAIRLQQHFQANEHAADQATSLLQITGYIYDVPGADVASQQREDLPSHVVFVTPKPAEVGLRATIQNVSASSFRRPRVTFVSYTPGSEIETSPHGIPTIRALFKAAFADHPEADTYTYVNADIAVDGSFVSTADAVVKAVRDGMLHERFLVVGKRTNVDWHEKEGLSDAIFGTVLHQGQPFLNTAQDYFMVSQKSFDWERVPPFIVGHRGYDNWLTGTAVHDAGMDVVDASLTLRAMHMTGENGNWEGYHADGSLDGQDYNMNLMVDYKTSLDYLCDGTDATNWKALMDSEGAVNLVRRNSSVSRLCVERKNKHKDQQGDLLLSKDEDTPPKPESAATSRVGNPGAIRLR